jgi:hypothetical protein
MGRQITARQKPCPQYIVLLAVTYTTNCIVIEMDFLIDAEGFPHKAGAGLVPALWRAFS